MQRDGGDWYLEGRLITDRHLLALGRRTHYKQFMVRMQELCGLPFFQSDLMDWPEPDDPFRSLMYFIESAERIHFNLETLGLADISRSSVETSGPITRAELGPGPMSFWEINQIFHNEAFLARTWWHTPPDFGKNDLAALWSERVDPDKIFNDDIEAKDLYRP